MIIASNERIQDELLICNIKEIRIMKGVAIVLQQDSQNYFNNCKLLMFTNKNKVPVINLVNWAPYFYKQKIDQVIIHGVTKINNKKHKDNQ